MTTTFDPDDLQRQAEGLRSLARRLVGDEHRAEDVMQEALAAVALRDVGPVQSPGGWLRGVVRNLSLRARRDEATRRRHEQATRARPSPGDPAEVVARAELLGLVVRALLALEEPYRSTLLRRYFDGLTAAEIAREQDVPAATVRTRLRRGLERLRERLDEEHGDRRAWSLLLVPLLIDPRPPPPPVAAPPFPLARWIPAGAVIVSAKKLALVAAATLVVVAAWWAADTVRDSDPRHPEAAPESVEGVARRERVEPSPPAAPEVADALPEPVDFTAIDPDLDLCGRVVADTGAPIAGARVEILDKPWQNRRVLNVEERDEEIALAESITARDGTFRVRLTRGERVTLRATHPGFAATELPICLAGQRVEVTLFPGVTLNVLVRGPDGQLLEGAAVDLGRVADNFAGLPAVHAKGVTDASGVCRLAGLSPLGSGTLMVGHPLGVLWLANVQLPATGESTVEVDLPAGRTIHGVVRDASTGRPIPGARVSDLWTRRRAARTGPDGAFALPNATSQTHALWAIADGYSEGSIRIQAESEVVIELHPARTVTGRLLGPGGQPVPGARIAVISEPADSLARVNVHGRSDADGRFRISGLAAHDPHVVIVMAEGLVRYVLDADPVPDGSDTLDLGDIALPQGRRVSGRAVSTSGVPLANVVVKLKGANSDRSRLRSKGGEVAEFYGTEETCWTGDRGRFHFTGVAPGSYGVTAIARGRKNASSSVEVTGSDVEDLELTFVGGRTLRARVEDEQGNPISMVSVTARTTDEWSLSAPTRADGVVEFDSDTPIVSIEAYSWNNGDVRFVAPPAQRVTEGQDEVTLVLRRVRAARGRVVLPDGRPLPGARFRVLIRGEVIRQESPFDEFGYVRATGEFEALVPDGEQAAIELVDASYVDEALGGALRVVGRAEGVAGGDEGVVIHAEPLPGDQSMELRVLDPDGRAIAGAAVRVHLAYAPQSHAPAITGRSGRAFVEGLQATDHVVTAELPAGHPGRAQWVAPSVTVAPSGEELVLRFREGEQVAGQLVDLDGAAVEGATIDVYANRVRLVSTTSDDDGRFAFAIAKDAALPLYLFAWVRRDGEVLEYRDAAFEAGQELRLTLRAR